MRRSRSLSRFRMRSCMASLYRTDISPSDLSISLVLRNPPLSIPAKIEMRESHDPDVIREEGNMLRQVSSSKSIPGARSLNENITREGPAALKRSEADAAHINATCLGLTARQRDVLAFMLQGKTNKAICRVLNLAEPTVKNHVTAILKTLKVTNRTEAVIKVSEAAVELQSF